MKSFSFFFLWIESAIQLLTSQAALSRLSLRLVPCFSVCPRVSLGQTATAAVPEARRRRRPLQPAEREGATGRRVLER